MIRKLFRFVFLMIFSISLFIGCEENIKDSELDSLRLEGGAEITTREPSPVSNNILQAKYSEFVFLSGQKDDFRVALTFDDGPDPRYTTRILDILKKHDARATFFLVGARAKAYPDIVKRMRDEGHSVGNHTFWHPNLAKEGTQRMHWELTQTSKVLHDILGYRTSLFRAPYGSLNEELVELAGSMGYKFIGWSVDSNDWMQLSSEQIKKNVLSNVNPGSIILMHDGGHWTMDLLGTVDALEEIIIRLKEDGIEFVTVDELLDLPVEKE